MTRTGFRRALVAGVVTASLLPACSAPGLRAGAHPGAALSTAARTTRHVTRGAEPVDRHVLLGRSAQGRPILAVELGDPESAMRILVVGCIHGDEPAGIPIADRLLSLTPPSGMDLWIVPDLNPDGVAAGTRQNGRGVDLNRNFPFRWRAAAHRGDLTYPGPRPLSEPESQIAHSLILRVHPTISIWFHQEDNLVDESGANVAVEREYAHLVGLRLRRMPRYPGSAIGWENHRLRGGTAFDVELPPGALTPERVSSFAGAVVELGRWAGGYLSMPAPTPSPSTARPVPRPRIVWKPIPFGAARRTEMTAYARRHYGIDTWKLVDPKVIVEHFTGGSSFSSAWNTFAANGPDLGELPGTCAHFIIDTDGTIYQLVPLSIMCRHTVGLNWTSVGIEHVGTSDAEILHDPKQLAASLHLTIWLMQRFGIQLRNVIGHNESLTSPYHRESYPAWQCQTHSDWNHADMQTYRRLLGGLLARYGIPLGPPARPVSTSCS